MNLDLPKHIYLIGIGGIGMSALARYFNAKGKNVCGYDKAQSTLCKQLENEGIKIHYNDGVENIDETPVNLRVLIPPIPVPLKVIFALEPVPPPETVGADL